MPQQKKSNNSFSIKEALSYGWHTAIENIWFFVIILLTTSVFSWIIQLFQDQFLKRGGLDLMIGLLAVAVGFVLSIEFNFAKLVIYLKFVDRKEPKFDDLFAFFDFRLLLKYFVITTAYSILIVVGFILLIFPGIYFFTKYYFAIYIYIDKKGSIKEAFEESAKLTKGIKMRLFYLSILQLLIMLGGVLALVVGLFVALP
ncbi:MAG TPA: hypothetical protein VF189_04915, partial [Patescibacteria group bacterium]